jgi:nucleoside triphosphatase
MKVSKIRSYPEPTVGAFIFDSQKKILLIRSPKWTKGEWHVPGGHIEIGESIKDAILRETFEETGLRGQFIRVFRIGESVFNKSFSRKKHFVFVECELSVGKNAKVVPDGKEVSEFAWFSLNEALELDLEPCTRQSLEVLDSEIRLGLQTPDILLQ